MTLVDYLIQYNAFQMKSLVKTRDNDEEMETLESNEIRMHSFGTIKIPLKSSQAILAASSNSILVDESNKKRKQLVLMNTNLRRFNKTWTITETIIDSLWYEKEGKYLLLTPSKIYALNPNTMNIDSLHDIKSKDKKPFKCFTILEKSSSLLIAYEEWEGKFIDKWNQSDEHGKWKLSERYPMDLDQHEFIETMAINEDLAVIIYDDLMQNWRMELRNINFLKCFRKIVFSRENKTKHYEITAIKSYTSNIKWLIYSKNDTKIIAIDANYKMEIIKYSFPIKKIVQYKEDILIVQTKKMIQIYEFI